MITLVPKLVPENTNVSAPPLPVRIWFPGPVGPNTLFPGAPIMSVIVKGAETKLVPATSVSVSVRLWVPADKLPVVRVQEPLEFT